jgi:replicative superfamily II helicase
MGQKFSEVEAVFHEEVHSKKKEFKDLRNATKHKRLGKKSVMFASDFMSRAEKKRHMGAGKIMTTNMYEDILPIAEFDALETYEQRNRLQYWRNEKSNKEILQGMGISSKRYYDIVQGLDLPKAPRGKNKGTPRKGSSLKKKEAPTPVAVSSVPEVVAPEVKEEPKVQEIIVNGLNVIFNGTYSAEKIEKQLTKFMLLLDGEEEDFYIELKLMQKQPTK